MNTANLNNSSRLYILKRKKFMRTIMEKQVTKNIKNSLNYYNK